MLPIHQTLFDKKALRLSEEAKTDIMMVQDGLEKIYLLM